MLESFDIKQWHLITLDNYLQVIQNYICCQSSLRGDGERLLDRDGDRDFERERDLLREALLRFFRSGERLRECLLDRLRLRLRLRESLGGPGLSSISLRRLSKNSAPSNFLRAYCISLYVLNSTTPSPSLSLFALVNVTSPADRKKSFKS